MNTKKVYHTTMSSTETIQHYALHPVHNTRPKNTTLSHQEENRICGDDISVHLVIEKERLIDWWFTGRTSMITTACSALFWEICIGKTLDEILQWNQETIIQETEIHVSYRRRRAQVIALLATQNAILSYQNKGDIRDFSHVLVEK